MKKFRLIIDNDEFTLSDIIKCAAVIVALVCVSALCEAMW